MHEFDSTRDYGYLPAYPFPEAKASTVLDKLGQMHQIAKESIDAYTTVKREIKTDDSLSDKGKRTRLQNKARELLDRLKRIADAELPKIDTKIEDLEHGLQRAGQAAADERVVESLRQSEIRSWFSALDASRRLEETQRALAEPQDRELLTALLAAPRAIRQELVPEKLGERIESEMLRTRSPETFQELQDLRQAVAVVRSILEIVETHVRKDSGLAVGTPMERGDGTPIPAVATA